jgi:hypothetical protein
VGSDEGAGCVAGGGGFMGELEGIEGADGVPKNEADFFAVAGGPVGVEGKV